MVDPRKRIQWSYTRRQRVYEILVRIEIKYGGWFGSRDDAIRSYPWELPLCQNLFEVVLHLSSYLVFWIGPVIDVVRASLWVTMGGGFSSIFFNS